MCREPPQRPSTAPTLRRVSSPMHAGSSSGLHAEVEVRDLNVYEQLIGEHAGEEVRP